MGLSGAVVKLVEQHFIFGPQSHWKFSKMSGKKLGFAENFALSGAAAIISKTAAAPIERVKLLVQNQDEMLKMGRLDKPYSGVMDCVNRTLKSEGVLPFWRGILPTAS